MTHTLFSHIKKNESVRHLCPGTDSVPALKLSEDSLTNPRAQFIQRMLLKNCVVCLIKHGCHVLLFHIGAAGQQIDLMVQKKKKKSTPNWGAYAASQIPDVYEP